MKQRALGIWILWTNARGLGIYFEDPRRCAEYLGSLGYAYKITAEI